MNNNLIYIEGYYFRSNNYHYLVCVMPSDVNCKVFICEFDDLDFVEPVISLLLWRNVDK